MIRLEQYILSVALVAAGTCDSSIQSSSPAEECISLCDDVRFTTQRVLTLVNEGKCEAAFEEVGYLNSLTDSLGDDIDPDISFDSCFSLESSCFCDINGEKPEVNDKHCAGSCVVEESCNFEELLVDADSAQKEFKEKCLRSTDSK